MSLSLATLNALPRRAAHYLPLVLAIIRRFLTVVIVAATVTGALRA